MRVEPAFRKWATHASLCSSAHGHVESHSHYGGCRRSGSYRTRNRVSSVYVHGYSSLMREGSRPRGRDPSRDRSAAIYFLRGDACQSFLFLSGAAGWNERRRVSENATQPQLQKPYRAHIFSVQVKDRVAAPRHSEYAILPAHFIRVALLHVARACIIMPHLHRQAEGMNGVSAADVRLFSFLLSSRITRTCLL